MAKKYLDDNGLLYFWGKIKATFALISHTHTKSEITDFPSTMTPSSHTHGNITNAGALQTTDVAIATGDKLVITDASNSSKVARASLTFDGSTATKALTQKGTFETFLTSADVPEGASASTTTPAMDGTATAGTETSFARGDHVHPTDTSRAPTSHASTATTYGKGTSSNYGHVKLSDSTSSTTAAASGGTAATPKAVSDALSAAKSYTDGLKGAASGICPLDANSKVDASYLPSYVDDVIEAYPRSGQTELSSTWLSTTSSGSALTPEAGKIYVLMADSTSYAANTQFRWGGSAYVKLADGGVTAITNAEIDTIVAS